MSALFIDDGYTQTKDIEARPGFHPAVEVVYRPALRKMQHEYAAANQALKAGDPSRIEKLEADLIEKYVVTLNGAAVEKAKAAKLHPMIRADLVDLILSFAPGAVPVEADAPNC